MSGFDIGRIDDVIHGRVRLGVMTLLAGGDALDFRTLRDRLEVTDGNLSVHLRKLEDAGFVAIDKSFAGRRPLTCVRLTEAGRTAYLAYLDAMRALLADVPPG